MGLKRDQALRKFSSQHKAGNLNAIQEDKNTLQSIPCICRAAYEVNQQNTYNKWTSFRSVTQVELLSYIQQPLKKKEWKGWRGGEGSAPLPPSVSVSVKAKFVRFAKQAVRI